MNDLQVFNYEGNEVRTVLRDGQPWFVAKDIAEILDYTWDRNLVKHIPEEWKGVNRIHSLGGPQEMSTLSEQGVYFFLARSDKPKALPFQKWIAGEVVPEIRRTGKYVLHGKNEMAEKFAIFLNNITLTVILETMYSDILYHIIYDEKYDDDENKVKVALDGKFTETLVSYRKTSKGRIQILSVIHALEEVIKLKTENEFFKHIGTVNVFTDAPKCYNIIRSHAMLSSWAKNNWCMTDGTPVQNSDLWARALEVLNKLRNLKVYCEFHPCQYHRADHDILDSVCDHKRRHDPVFYGTQLVDEVYEKMNK